MLHTMRLLRRRVRGFFALQAVFMTFAGGLNLAHSASADAARSAAAQCMAALMFAGAWWTTRKPAPYRNPWAMAASIVSLATGAYMVWAAHVQLRFSRSGWLSIILGIAGLYLYSQGGRNPRPRSIPAPAE
jgi:hypothetical protein